MAPGGSLLSPNGPLGLDHQHLMLCRGAQAAQHAPVPRHTEHPVPHQHQRPRLSPQPQLPRPQRPPRRAPPASWPVEQQLRQRIPGRPAQPASACWLGAPGEPHGAAALPHHLRVQCAALRGGPAAAGGVRGASFTSIMIKSGSHATVYAWLVAQQLAAACVQESGPAALIDPTVCPHTMLCAALPTCIAARCQLLHLQCIMSILRLGLAYHMIMRVICSPGGA